MLLTQSTPASHIEGAADRGNVTLYNAGVVLSSNDHKYHAARVQSSCMYVCMSVCMVIYVRATAYSLDCHVGE